MFVPFWNPEHYFSDLLRCGTSSDHVEHLRRLHKENPPKVEEWMITKPKVVTKYDFTVPSMVALQEKYYKFGKMPPLNERIKALNDCGYSDEILMNVIKSHEKKMAESDELDAFIFNIFGEHNEKKQSAPKKRTITQILKIKKRVYARPDIEDDEDDAVSEFEDLPPVEED
jgi:hypothetical protein